MKKPPKEEQQGAGKSAAEKKQEEEQQPGTRPLPRDFRIDLDGIQRRKRATVQQLARCKTGERVFRRFFRHGQAALDENRQRLIGKVGGCRRS